MSASRRGHLAVACLSIALAAARPALAWNHKGHMMVACLAYTKLAPATRARVDDLLRLNPDYRKWAANLPAGASDAEKRLRIFMMASTWADRIKSSALYTDDGTASGRRPDGAASSLNTGYRDTLRHRYWHFVDVPFAEDGSPLPPIPTPNTLDRIHLFRAVLASATESDELKSYDLVWLLHLVGDVHQPLHAATRVSATHPDGDQNGGLVTVYDARRKSDLRAFWNTIPGPQTSVAAAKALAKTLPAAPADDAAVLDEAIWVRESFELTRSQVYKRPVGAGAGPFTVTPAYRRNAKAVSLRQIALAGARLANVLNAELK